MILVPALLTIAATAVSAQQTTQSDDAKRAATLYDMGVKLLDEGNAVEALTLLKMSASLQKQNVRYSHALASAYYEAERIGDFWVEIRRAVRIDPHFEPAVNDFEAIWKFHDSKGMTNMGVDISQVRAALGDPDQAMKQGRERLVYGFNAIDFTPKGKLHRIVDLRGLSNDVFDYHDEIWLSFDDRKWQAGHQQVNRNTLNTEFVLPGESVQNWTELVSHQRMFHMSRRESPREAMERIRTLTQQAVPDVLWNVLDESDDHIMYEWRTEGNDEQDAQHEIARLIAGQRDMHRIAYVAKGSQLDQRKRSTWLKIIGSVNLTNNRRKSTRAASVDAKQLVNDSIVWNLGRNLSTAALMNARGGDAGLKAESFTKAKQSARALGITLPSLPSVEEDGNANIASLIGYLIPTMGKELGTKLTTREIAMYSVAVKSNLLPLLYADERSRTSLASGLESAATTAQLPKAIWQPLLDCVNAGEPGREAALAVLKMHKNIDAYFALATKDKEVQTTEVVAAPSGTRAQ